MKTKWLKRVALLATGLGLSLGINAQNNLLGSTGAITNKTDTTGISAPQQPKEQLNSFIAEYVGIDGGWGYGMSIRLKHVMVGYDFLFGETNSTVTENNAWNISAGGNYRHWLGKRFFMEGTAGLGYFHNTLEYKVASGTETYYIFGKPYSRTKYTSEKNKNGEIGLFINPRIGIKLFNFTKAGLSCALTVSYRWNFLKFKFKKEYTQDYFTVGLSLNV